MNRILNRKFAGQERIGLPVFKISKENNCHNNYFKCKRMKFSSQKTENGCMGKTGKRTNDNKTHKRATLALKT